MVRGKQMSDDQEVEQLYKHFEVLSDVTDEKEAQKAQAAYKAIIKAVGGSNKGKALAAQLIPKFLHWFPKLADESIDALLDLCEDEDLSIRVHAIRGLPILCKSNPEHFSKMADVLGQLLLAEDTLELDNVKKAFISLFRIDSAGALNGLFAHVQSEDETLRLAAVIFFKDKILTMRSELLGTDEASEKTMADLLKKAMAHERVSADDFKLFLNIILSLTIYKKPDALKELGDIIIEKAGLSDDFELTDGGHLNRLLSCLQISQPLLSRGVASGRFLVFLGTKALPVLDTIQESHKVPVLRAIADLSRTTTADDARAILDAVYQAMLVYIPKKPEGTEAPSINYTYVECLLFTFHQLGAVAPGFLHHLCGIKIVTGQPSDVVITDSDTIKDRLTDFRDRLSYLERSTHVYSAQLQQAIQHLDKEVAKGISDVDKARTAVQKKKKQMDAKPAEPAEKSAKIEVEGVAADDAPAVEEKKEEEPVETVTETDAEILEKLEKSLAEIQAESTKLKTKKTSIRTALRTTDNIRTLAKGILRTPEPQFLGPRAGTRFFASWIEDSKKRPMQNKQEGNSGKQPAKKMKRQPYVSPHQQQQRGGRGGFRGGRGRGGFRGRGWGKKW